MPLYSVTLTRTTTETAEIEVKAESEDQAEERANKMLRAPTTVDTFTWDLNDIEIEIDAIDLI